MRKSCHDGNSDRSSDPFQVAAHHSVRTSDPFQVAAHHCVRTSDPFPCSSSWKKKPTNGVHDLCCMLDGRSDTDTDTDADTDTCIINECIMLLFGLSVNNV